MMSRDHVIIDLCSYEESKMLPSNISIESWGAPDHEQKAVEKCSSSASSNTSESEFILDDNCKAISGRYVLSKVDGVEILEFESEVDMEFYVNHNSVNSGPDEEFFGFDIRKKPSTILMDFFEKIKKPRLSSCFTIDDAAPQNTLRATSSTAMPEDENKVKDDEDCIIVQGECFVPIRVPICWRCGKYSMKKKKKILPLPSITEVISLDSDEEDIAYTSSSNTPHTNVPSISNKANYNISPEIVDKTLIHVSEIVDAVSSERTLLKRPCSNHAVSSQTRKIHLDESVRSDYSHESVGSTSSCTSSTSHGMRFQLDSVDGTSPANTSTTETVFDSMFNQDDEKDIDSHSIKIHDSLARMSTTLEARKEFSTNPNTTPSSIAPSTVIDEIISLDVDDDIGHVHPAKGSSTPTTLKPWKAQTNIKPVEEMMDCAVSTLEREFSIKTSLTSFAMPTDIDEIICLDSDDESSHFIPNEASSNKTLHESVLNQGIEKIIESRAITVRNFSVVPALIIDPTLQTKMVCSDLKLEEVLEVVHDIVDFVCRQEDIADEPLVMEPYAESYSPSRNVHNVPSCMKPYCTMGCICYCLRRKWKRNRCLNPDCIFGCICHSLLKPRGLTTKHRRSEPHTSDVENEVALHTFTEIIAFGSSNNESRSTVLYPSSKKQRLVMIPQSSRQKQSLVPTKIGAVDCIVLEPQLSDYNSVIHPVGTMTPSVTKKTGRMVQQSLWKPNSIFKKKKKKKLGNPSMHLQHILGNMRLKKRMLARGDLTKMYVQTCQRSQNLTLTDVTPPAFALTCLTPGIGYIALEEFGPSILRLCDPFEPSDRRTFTSVSLATDWLNYNLRVRLKFEQGVELKWVVANSTMIQVKKIKRFESKVLLNPRCRITKNGVVFV